MIEEKVLEQRRKGIKTHAILKDSQVPYPGTFQRGYGICKGLGLRRHDGEEMRSSASCFVPEAWG